MHITHEQAHKLIQLGMDHSLNSQESAMLSSHLQGCTACQSYASEMSEVERLLVPLLKKRWRHSPVPLSITALTEENQKTQTSNFLAMRKAAIGLVVAAFFFSAWQFALSGSPSQLPALPPPIPTPSAPSTSTAVALENCEMTLYIVRQEDTLAGIAATFSASEEEVVAINSLPAGTIHAGMELIVPICQPTPTGTVASTLLTRTYTPAIHLVTSTPAGNY